MFAVAGLIIFVLAVFGVRIGTIHMGYLGGALICAHLAFGAAITLPRFGRRPAD